MTYPSDLNYKQWDLIKHHFDTGKYGTVRTCLHSLLNLLKSNKEWAIQ